MGKLVYSAREIHDGVVSTMNMGGSGVAPPPPDQIQYIPIEEYNRLKKKLNISLATNLGAGIGIVISWVVILATF